jgi:transcription initiation factor TFIID subunit 8
VSERALSLYLRLTNLVKDMLRLLSDVRASMQTHRRASPTAQDFRMAMAHMPNTRSASLLAPQLELPIPETVSYPSIPQPGPPPAPAPDLSALLQPLLAETQPQYVPSHFPQLPPQHAWKETPVFPTREKDSRKMREKATEEGMLAEQALRKLAAAAKAGAMKAESRRRSSAPLAGMGRVRDGTSRKRAAPEMLFDDVLNDVAESHDADYAMAPDGADDRGRQPTQSELEERVVVNSGMGNWRGGAGRGLL